MNPVAHTEQVAPIHVPSPAQRLFNVSRLHVANPYPTLVVPWAITAVIFGLNIAIAQMVVSAAGGTSNLDADAFQYNGGITWIVVFMLVVGVQAMSLTFPFALGFGVTRKDFYWGSTLYFVGLSVLYATGLTLLSWLERATDGWGIDMAFFQPWGLMENPLSTVWLLYATSLLGAFFVGAATSAVWVRWRAIGMYVFFSALAIIVVGAGWLITSTNSWAKVGEFFTSTSIEALALWSLPFTGIVALVGYTLIRRATSR
ncbi:hypothetical protein [Demequina sediminicola]|uniref:hypothetical protein n=1 Tax=Demequina sediminicola TaxID=1095026 RepID=UPI000780747A|nr:hypothetical protein [Demequina sediminicola]